MKKNILLILATVLFSFSIAFAEEVRTSGVITNIKIYGGSATVVLRDTKRGEDFIVKVTDSLTIYKINENRIKNGDEIRVKYDNSTGVAKLFKKTGGDQKGEPDNR